MQVLNAEQHDTGVPVKAWIDGVELEDAARAQLLNVAQLPFIFKHVAVMPDVHWGKGATVGSVIATRGAIVPAAVGVDIGCGMMAVKLPLRADDLRTLSEIRGAIEHAIPHGRTHNGGPDDTGAWPDPPPHVLKAWVMDLGPRLAAIIEKHPKLARANSVRHLATLGTGNHFIEVCVDEASQAWVMLHSGSRGIGNAIGSYFIERAKRHMERYFVTLPDQDLAYLPEDTDDFRDYMVAMQWAQDFALVNRALMMGAAVGAVIGGPDQRVSLGEAVETILAGESAVNCHHNFTARENHFGQNVFVTRKGAVRAREGELGIIPGSMGAQSFIVRGKGNRDSFASCSHGAGRRMSRTAARKLFTLEDHAIATAGVECRKDEAVLDETPAAYKDIRRVIDAQRDLVDVVHTLKQVLCVKG